MEEIPDIQKVMTSNPQTLDMERPTHEARKLMEDLNIRHIPIMRGKQVIGMLSDRDLRVASSLESQLNKTLTVGELCSLDVYSVAPDTKLDIVVKEMAARGVGSVVIVDAGELQGIYTTMDVCVSFSDYLRSMQLRY